MAEINRRDLLMMGLSLSVSARMAGASSLFVNAPGGMLPRKSPLTGLKEVIATTMHRKPAPKDLGNWGYAVSLYLYGRHGLG
jgi:hypothetical protein